MTDHANGNSSRDPDAVTRPEKIDSLPPNVHCARIRILQKLIRYAETRIRYQQELIDIETFDQRDTDAAQLQSYIHAKGATELDYNMKLGKERQNPAFAPLLLTPSLRRLTPTQKKPKTNDKNTSNNTTEVITQKELPENTIPVNNPFSVLTIDDNDMEVAGSVENRDITQPKVKPIMLKFKKNFNLILQHLNRKYPDSINKLTGEYIKITAANIDQHGEITNELKRKERSSMQFPTPEIDH
ncbi:hypothetical protein TNCV_4035761 [Trichonephila clavipes]|nr:hypothetical protein TNCV_4035761 [Trichonephila clavipes]